MIAWLYLNKKTAAIDALKDYGTMRFIIDNYEDTLADMKEKMVSLPSTLPTGIPKQRGNLKAGEARLVHAIAEIDVLQERYRQALEYMDWFQSAWEALSEDERYILTEFFMQEAISKSDAVLNVGDRFCLERAQVYRKKDAAVDHLVLLLYGK